MDGQENSTNVAGAQTHPLIGHAVLEFRDNECERQGRITGVFDQTVMVQLYDWLAGDPTTIALVPLEEVGRIASRASTDNGWMLFASDEARNTYYDTWIAKGR